MVGCISRRAQSWSRSAIDQLRHVLPSQYLIVPSHVRFTTSLGQLWISVLRKEGGDSCEGPSFFLDTSDARMMSAVGWVGSSSLPITDLIVNVCYLQLQQEYVEHHYKRNISKHCLQRHPSLFPNRLESSRVPLCITPR